MPSVEERLAAVEAVVAELTAGRDSSGAGVVSSQNRSEDRFWLLEGLQRRHPDGAVAFAGLVPTADGPISWQWGEESDRLLAEEWTGAAAALAALGHPVRLRLVQRVLTGTRTTAELAGDDELGTSGQLHHHLRALVAAGWLRSTGRGHYAVPGPRVVPLLVIVSAAR